MFIRIYFLKFSKEISTNDQELRMFNNLLGHEN